ncbi:hypothetical protein HYX70_04300 [Candidatus Saccharibacteria bacterium]|nr:hypothetical protein [Candidatus Saccharibacteria bacterium]
MQLSKENLRKIFGLTHGQIWLIVLLDAGIFLLINFNLILLKATQGTVLADTAVQDSFAEQISKFTNSAYINLGTLIVFWAGVGLIAYSVIYSLYSVYNEARNEVVVEKEYVNRGEAKKRLKAPMVQAGLLAAIVVLGMLTLKFFYPIWLSLFATFVLTITSNPFMGMLSLVGAVFGSIINIYLFKILISWIVVLE